MLKTSLSKWLITQARSKNIEQDLRLLVEVVARACKTISREVNKGLIGNVLGESTNKNCSGDIQKKLDIMSNDILLEANEWGGHLAGMASEELDTVYQIPGAFPRGSYLLVFDPLDGSSNVDVNLSIGTIFSVLKSPHRLEHVDSVSELDFLQPGNNQIAAGYAIYGPQTMLVLTLGFGVYCFTLDRESGSFILTNQNIKIPAATSEFAINVSNMRHWDEPVQKYIEDLLAGKVGVLQKDYNLRWLASMVAEIHRILMRGGIFMYPWDKRNPERRGLLRLMYEANPMAFIVEQAGGLATNGINMIMDIQPEKLHERTAVFMGSSKEVERVIEYHQRYNAKIHGGPI